MKLSQEFSACAVGFGVLGVIASSASGQTIYQSGGSGTTYTDATGDAVATSLPANPLRDLSYATFSNDGNNLYISLAVNPTGDLATGGSYNYIIGLTPGNSGAGGDTSANGTTHGNAYGRAISFSSAFGGMTDFIGLYGAGPSGAVGSAAHPFTSFGYNDYVFGTPNNTTTTSGAWTKISTVASGESFSSQTGTSLNNIINLTIPLSDFADNLSLTPGTTFDFDIFSTGTSGNQTAYDSLADQSPTQTGTYNGTAQYNGLILDQYTIAAVPEPSIIALGGMAGLSLVLFRRRVK
jgi:hypothetical protein